MIRGANYSAPLGMRKYKGLPNFQEQTRSSVVTVVERPFMAA